ncbi:MAG: CocE/NonD family hydrolase [Xanthomonadales bacterium]|nr:CocE/NonD family hydrolase [Xanthomonadales bacterium]
MQRIKTDFPHAIRETENTWITLTDGTRLAARIWLPVEAADRPFPALLEYIPYRKNDGTAIRDAIRHPYLAGHGYACVRVDLRGSGESGGILYDEYLQQEQDDCLEVLEWIAAQAWCTGSIGMFGKSWGGFNSLQVAARRPPQLRAVITIGFTDDRYHDDVHYMGGCVLASQMLPWAAVMFGYNAQPPDPRWVGDEWRDLWLERLDKTPPYVETWLQHQRRDAFWKHGSVREDHGAIEVPVYAVGGWGDAYNNSIPRLLAGLSVPRKGLIGAWSHNYPEEGVPGPAMGFTQESLRWWDHWLKGKDTGVMDEPMLRSFILESEPPATHYTERKGHWVADPSWPSPCIKEEVSYLTTDGAANTLAEAPETSDHLNFRGQLCHGFHCGEWGNFFSRGEFPPDQRTEDGECLAFTAAPVTEPVTILGNPEVDLELAADKPNALVAVRLCDVAPDGSSVLVSWGLLNLTHRDSDENPEPLEPDKRYRVTVQLRMAGYELATGHRWRIGLSPTFTRHAWPSPELVTLKLIPGEGSRLRLPVRAPQAPDLDLPDFEPAEISAPLGVSAVRSPRREHTVTQDHVNQWITFRQVNDEGRWRFIDHGLEMDHSSTEIFRVREGDPLSTRQQIRSAIEFQRTDWRVRIETDSVMTASATHFHLSSQLDAYEGDTRVFTKCWTRDIPRDNV